MVINFPFFFPAPPLFLFLTQLRSIGVKPVTTPVSAYANLLFCHFIRQGKKTRGPSWLQMRLAPGPVGMLHSAEMLRAERGEGRQARGFYGEVTQPLDAFTAQLNQNGLLKFPKLSQKKIKERRDNFPSNCLYLLCKYGGINMAVAKTWHTRVCHTQPPPARTHPPFSILSPSTAVLIPSSSGALPQRSPLNHMCQRRSPALAPGLIVRW